MSGFNQAEFDAWNAEKKALQLANRQPPKFKEREIWWCALGVNLGHEQNGDTVPHNGRPATFRRPVLVLKKLSATGCVVLPLTTREKTGSWYFPLSVQGRQNWVLLDQVRFISAIRLNSRLVTLPEREFEDIRQACRGVLDL